MPGTLVLLLFPCSFPCPVPRRRSICLRRVSVRLFILVSPLIGLSNFHIRKLLQRCRVSLTRGNVLLLHCLVSEKWEPAHSTHIITSAVAVVRKLFKSETLERMECGLLRVVFLLLPAFRSGGKSWILVFPLRVQNESVNCLCVIFHPCQCCAIRVWHAIANWIIHYSSDTRPKHKQTTEANNPSLSSSCCATHIHTHITNKQTLDEAKIRDRWFDYCPAPTYTLSVPV